MSVSSIRFLQFIASHSRQMFASMIMFSLLAVPVLAQGPGSTRNQPPPSRQVGARPVQQPGTPAGTQQPANKDKVEIPEPENLILDTTDGVRLMCTYFGPPKSKDSNPQNVVPFILLHDWEGSRQELLQYGAFLQNAGHAAIVPDLRGHGESVQVTGFDKPIDATKFRKGEVISAQKDIERCKKFLVQRHNDSELNIDLLSVVAVGETCVLAVQWTLNDWFAFPAFNADGIKQGQDVKALLLVSPVKKIAGISMVPNLKHPLFTGANGAAIPMLITWGASEETAKESEAIANLLEKARPDVKGIEDEKERLAQTSLFTVPIRKYKYSGKEMMASNRVNNFWPYISGMLFEQKVVAHADKFPWKTRKPKKDEDE